MKVWNIFLEYIFILKRYYIIIIIVLPIYIEINGTLMLGLDVKHTSQDFYKIIGYININIFILIALIAIFYIFKRKYMMAFFIFFSPIISIIITNKVLCNYGIDGDMINFLIHREEYKYIIENTPSITKKNTNKLMIVKIPTRYTTCKRYLVYDESDEIANKDGQLWGIGYNYATYPDGTKFHSSNDSVIEKKYDEHLYITDVCSQSFP